MSVQDRLLRILLVEDDEDDFLITHDLLREASHFSYHLDRVETYEEGKKAISSQEHDLALIDYRLGAESGMDLVQYASHIGIRIPLILLVDQDDGELDINALEMGAADYLVKGQITSSLLVRSIRYAIERSLSIEVLAESEKRYRLLFESNPEPMYIHHRETLAVLAVNQAALRLFGYSYDEAIQLSVPDLLSSCERQRFYDHYQEIDSLNATPKVGIWVIKCKGGDEVSVEITAHDYVFNDQPSRLILLNDITERVQARNEARRQERVFHQLLSDSRDALLVIDSGGVVRYANPAATSLFCSSLDALLKRRLDFPLLGNNLFEWSVIIEGEEAVIVEIQRSQTEWEGETMYLFSLRDIRQRKEAEKQLYLLKRSIESSYNGVAIADALAPDMPLIYVNPAFERITGYTAEEVVGMNCRFLQLDDRYQPGVEQIRLGLQEQCEVHTVLRNFRKDGSAFWNELYITPVRNEDGIVSHYISVQSDISEKKRFESELAFHANHDVLTGLPNRSLLEDRLVQGCQFAKRHQCHLAIILLDLDGFKPINDSMGHAAGDQVLVEVARRLGQQIRPGDTSARMGGDEFVILLPDLARQDDVLQIVERLLACVALPYQVGDTELRITASAGISVSDGEEANPLNLVQQADLAMYEAKKRGRNNYQWYTRDLNQKVSESVTLRNELQKAIESEGFELYFQPQVSSDGQHVIGMEALLRWHHREMGFISPKRIISIAEETGQIFALNRWVMETACRQVKSLKDQGLVNSPVAVNISPLQFHRSHFVEFVGQVLERTQLEAKFLELELTETILLGNAEHAVQTLHELKRLGVRLAIDDFGTGFSSLSYLKRLPIDKIKIDRTFIKEIISDQHDAAITQGIISMAHHLGLQVVAEGVETEPQFAFLRKSQCDSYQGYYFSKPLGLESLRDYLQQRQGTLDAKPLPRREEEELIPTLLLLDDEENILRALTRVLRREGYRILTANRAHDAFELLAKHDVQVILSDQRMPEMNGTAFFSRVKDLYPETIRIVLSGYTDLQSVTEAINQGAIYKFLTKPWDDEQLRLDIKQAFQHFTATQEKGVLP
ncbi:hypothetical protein L861_00175 [Litchfieldella anticariensis FP35 = DSM 16096]|uniref:cyclic-guanylate-specific phosphodiesterase n=1 Tax=Litchfieldella anticariensis (strain DSM 16096 / CECT 5854 / CIP 108499 / LMG 22089 / FP35) TaxID=1121939 RepID=S2KPA1_LITA3|nr:EAL domain-containing protein [Halomonas anticariensis]EPC03745.1 hypothetical protein L861_00175 [Halomonas anticariensis FP35 = DSM 16096]